MTPSIDNPVQHQGRDSVLFRAPGLSRETTSQAAGTALTRPSAPGRHLAFLALLILLTRIPLLGVAEADSALFSTGVAQWLRGGPHSVAIYSASACATYYASIAALVHTLHLGLPATREWMSVFSLVAGLLIVFAGYMLGRKLVGTAASFRAMILFAISPGLWWVTVEPHPEAVAISLAYCGIWAYGSYSQRKAAGRRSPWWHLAPVFLALTAAIAVKNDAVLLVPALMAIGLWFRPSWRALVIPAVIGTLSALSALLINSLVVRASAGGSLGNMQTTLGIFFRIPKPMDLVREGPPIVFGLGLIAALGLAWAIVAGLRRDRDRTRWLVLLAFWCVPGYLFWLCIAGNNIRHVLAFGLPLFWLGGKYLRTRYVVAIGALSLLVPPNSNVFMFPSPNVPFSARLFRQKQVILATTAQSLASRNSCFIGSYTSDYLANMLLDRGGQIQTQWSPTDSSAATVRMPGGNVVQFDRINTTQHFVPLGGCDSLEYDKRGKKTRFFGGEWHIPIL